MEDNLTAEDLKKLETAQAEKIGLIGQWPLFRIPDGHAPVGCVHEGYFIGYAVRGDLYGGLEYAPKTWDCPEGLRHYKPLTGITKIEKKPDHEPVRKKYPVDEYGNILDGEEEL